MSDVLIRLLEIPAPSNMITIAVILGSAVPLVAIVATEVRKFGTHRLELQAKREMIEQGLSVAEIERVLKAGGDAEK